MVSAHNLTLKDVTNISHGDQGVIKAVMEVIVGNSIQRCAPAQCTFSVLTKIVSGSSTQESVADQASQTVGRSKVPMGDHRMVARQLPRVDPPKVVAVVAPMATREGVDSRVADPRWVRVTRIHFFSY